jgi:hypothetical protein
LPHPAMEVGALYSHLAVTLRSLLGDMDGVSHLVMVEESLIHEYDSLGSGVGVAIENEHVESSGGHFALDMILVEKPRNGESDDRKDEECDYADNG